MSVEIDYNLIGENVRKRRKELKLSQEQLAEKAGVTRQTVIDLENHKHNKNAAFDTVFQVAKALDCSIDFLTGHDTCSTHEIQGVHDYTGLSEKAIRKLNVYNTKAVEKYNAKNFYDPNDPIIVREGFAFNAGGYFLEIISDIIMSDNFVDLIREYASTSSAFIDVEIRSKDKWFMVHNNYSGSTSWQIIDYDKKAEHYYSEKENADFNSVEVNGKPISPQVIKQALLNEIKDCIEDLFKE